MRRMFTENQIKDIAEKEITDEKKKDNNIQRIDITEDMWDGEQYAIQLKEGNYQITAPATLEHKNVDIQITIDQDNAILLFSRQLNTYVDDECAYSCGYSSNSNFYLNIPINPKFNPISISYHNSVVIVGADIEEM